MATRKSAEEFWEKFEALGVRDGKGKIEIRSDVIVALVREYPEETVGAVQSCLHIAAEDPKYFQRAESLAGAYQIAEGDDSLSLLVKDALRNAGVTDTGTRYRELNGDSASTEPKPIHIDIDKEMLARTDVFPLVRLLSLERATERHEAHNLARLKGRVFLSFHLDEDPRPVWKIPESRKFVAHMFEALPYFPYFLLRDPRIAAVREAFDPYLVFFGCLADLSAMQGNALNLGDDSVIEKVLQSLDAIGGLCEALGEDAHAARRETLDGFPPQFVEAFLQAYPQYR